MSWSYWGGGGGVVHGGMTSTVPPRNVGYGSSSKSLCYVTFRHKRSFNPFVTSPGDLRDLGRLFRYEARRSPGLIA